MVEGHDRSAARLRAIPGAVATRSWRAADRLLSTLWTRFSTEDAGDDLTEIELIRSLEEEKGQQIANVAGYRGNRNRFAGDGFRALLATAREQRNVFESLMEAVKTHSLGQISHVLFEVGGEYRRNM